MKGSGEQVLRRIKAICHAPVSAEVSQCSLGKLIGEGEREQFSSDNGGPRIPGLNVKRSPGIIIALLPIKALILMQDTA